MKNFRVTSITVQRQADADSVENKYSLILGKEGSLKFETLTVKDEDSLNKAGISDQFEIGSKPNVKLMVKHLNSNHAACKEIMQTLTGSTIVDGVPAGGVVEQTMTTSSSLNRASSRFLIEANIIDMRTNVSGTAKISEMYLKPESELNLKTEYSDNALEFVASEDTVCELVYTVDDAS